MSEMKEKYIMLLDDSITIQGNILYRIKALRSFNDVTNGAMGGYVQSEHNLSHYGACWIYENGLVFGHGRVYGNGQVCENGRVYGNGRVSQCTTEGTFWSFLEL